MKTETTINESNPRTLAYAIAHAVLNENVPAAFINFFADLCSKFAQTGQLYDVAELCFKELADMEATRTTAKLRRKFNNLMNNY